MRPIVKTSSIVVTANSESVVVSIVNPSAHFHEARFRGLTPQPALYAQAVVLTAATTATSIGSVKASSSLPMYMHPSLRVRCAGTRL